MKFRHFVFFILPWIVLNSCNEGLNETDVTLEKISEQYREYTLFESGSNWTYVEEETSDTSIVIIDSVFFYIGVNYKEINNNIDFQYEAFEMFLNPDNPMGFKKYEIAATKEKKVASDMNSLLRLFIDNKYHTIFQPCFQFGDTIEIGTVSGNYININYYPNFQIGDIVFTEVYYAKVLDSFNPEGFETMEIYISRGVGIIRFTRTTPDSYKIWNLKHWSATVIQ